MRAKRAMAARDTGTDVSSGMTSTGIGKWMGA